jgi:sirohydrochlorin cobaltochelatase
VRVLIVVAHGSRKKASAAEVAALAEKLEKKSRDFDWITHAFLQFSDPLLPEVIAAAVDKGADQVVLFPFFIATGGHVLEDIPEAAAQAKDKYPGVSFTITRHLGVADGVPDLILDEVAAQVAGMNKGA